MENVKMFVNGQAMSGGSISQGLSSARFLREARTSEKYKFYSVRDEHPGLSPVSEGGREIVGEVYEVSYANLRNSLLPLEPPELELAVIELSDGSGSLAMVMRTEELNASGVMEITSYGGWREYLKVRNSNG